jgi:probable phosphoglycerate mutase
MELLFVRHAQPAWEQDGVVVDDPGLTQQGHEQARHLARRLEGEHFDQVYVSPMRRTRETAEPVLAALDAPHAVTDWLEEIRGPALGGRPAEKVQEFFAEHRRRPVDELWHGLDGGESFRDFHERVGTGITGLLAEQGIERVVEQPPLWSIGDPDRRVLVVAHGGTNAVSLGHLLGIAPTPWEWERFVSFHASISTIQPVEIGGGWSFSLYRFADVAHLPTELQTR